MKWRLKAFLVNIVIAIIVLVGIEYFRETGNYTLIAKETVGIAIGITAAEYVIKHRK